MTNIFVLKYYYDPVINLPLHEVQYAFAAPILLWHNNPKPPAVLGTIVNVAAKNDIVPRLGEENHYTHHHYNHQHTHYVHTSSSCIIIVISVIITIIFILFIITISIIIIIIIPSSP